MISSTNSKVEIYRYSAVWYAQRTNTYIFFSTAHIVLNRHCLFHTETQKYTTLKNKSTNISQSLFSLAVIQKGKISHIYNVHSIEIKKKKLNECS